MRERELTTLLQQLHGKESCGGLSPSASDRVWNKVSAVMVSKPSVRPTLLARALVLPRLFADAVARPAMISMLIMVLALGGWIGGVNASLTTVPGDTLYGMKLVSEKAQLSLASDTSKPKLQAEFASRRVREVAELVKREEAPEIKKQKVQVAVNGFKKHVSELREGTGVQSEESVVEIARVVEEKEAQMKEVLTTVQEEATSEGVAMSESSVESAISEGVEVATEAKEQVVETLVARVEEAKEESKEEEVKLSSEELERQIKNALRSISADSQLLLTRIDRVEKALSLVIARSVSDEAISAPQVKDLRMDVIDVRQTRYVLRAQLEPVGEAMDIAASGAYREALKRIAVITEQLEKIKAVLTDSEIKLVQMAQEDVAALHATPDKDTVPDPEFTEHPIEKIP